MKTIEEVKNKLIKDYAYLAVNQDRYEKNDNQLMVEDCISKRNYIYKLVKYITDLSGEEVEHLFNHYRKEFDFDPQKEPDEWEFKEGTFVELQQDVYYADLATILEDWETTEDLLIRDGFIIEEDESYKCKWVLIPKGTVMKFLGPDCNSWGEFLVRMRTEDYQLTFAGDPFKIKLL